jgi:hypothetical protein
VGVAAEMNARLGVDEEGEAIGLSVMPSMQDSYYSL